MQWPIFIIRFKKELSLYLALLAFSQELVTAHVPELDTDGAAAHFLAQSVKERI